MENIEFSIIRSKRRTISIEICADEKIIVRAPLKCSKNIIEKFIKEKSIWIKEKLKLIREKRKSLKKRMYIENEMFKFLGVEYPLKLESKSEKRIKAFFDNNKFIIYCLNNEREIKETMIQLYKNLAKKVLRERTIHYSKIINVIPNKITIKEQKTIWGSCSSQNNINYNWKIIIAPLRIVDYLVVHELCHIKHRNHSKNFWDEVQKYIPDYEERRSWLKKYGITLSIDYI